MCSKLSLQKHKVFCCLIFKKKHLLVSAAPPKSQINETSHLLHLDKKLWDWWRARHLCASQTAHILAVFASSIWTDLPEVKRAVCVASIFISISRVLHALLLHVRCSSQGTLFWQPQLCGSAKCQMFTETNRLLLWVRRFLILISHLPTFVFGCIPPALQEQ